MQYPIQAKRMGIEGRVLVELIVNADGTLSDIKVIRGIGAGCDEEAIRVTKLAGDWMPGKQNGKPVNSRFRFEITFKLF